ncbi:MAG: Hsp70 family protein [bacterium]|nr:Hsp70 family protein [bacterium]
MSTQLAYGIDFGTTNSSIAVAYPERIEVLQIGDDRAMPSSLSSILYLHRDGLRLSGAEATDQFTITGKQSTNCRRCALVTHSKIFGYESDCQQFDRRSGCLDSRLMSDLKSALTDDSFEKTHSWAKDFELEDLVSFVLSHLKSYADRHTGQNVTRAVIGHPIAFVGAEGDRFDERQRLAENRLLDAARRAGFADVELYPEPVAAVLDEVVHDGYLVAVDFGGGTFDIAVTSINAGEGEVVSMDGATVGGCLFDRKIFEAKVASRLGLHHRSVPGWFRRGLSSLETFKHLLTSQHTFQVLNDLERSDRRAGSLVRSIVTGGQAYPFYKAIENAKIALSSTELTHIDFHSPQGDLSIALSRAELDQMVSPYLQTVEEQVMKALDKARIGPEQVTTVLRTGGSSRLGAFVEMLDLFFGADKVQEREAFTTVAYGLGVVAQETWL